MLRSARKDNLRRICAMRFPPSVLFITAFCCASAYAQGMDVFGDPHSHTSLGNGSGLPNLTSGRPRCEQLELVNFADALNVAVICCQDSGNRMLE